MPELPEVEVTRRGIAPDLESRRLTGVDFRTYSLRYPLPHDDRPNFVGQRLDCIERRAKYLLLRFKPGTLLIHLGMSGSLRLVAPGLSAEKHDHVDLVFGEGVRAKVLRLRDPRRFGALLWLPGKAADVTAHPLLRSLGIEPLTPEFTAHRLKQMFTGLSAPVKTTLMDSHRVVGIGNIYASESLFRARIDPRTSAGRISLARLEILVLEIKKTLTGAIEAGGSSLRDFIHSDGSSGYFQQQYFVYGRTGQPCRVCGTAVRELRQANRASFYCPRCQH